MPVIVDQTCLFSTVKNISGIAMNFPFLPPHGKKLDNNEIVTVFGSILEAISRSNDRFGNRDQNGLLQALERDWLEIQNTPAPILLDEVVTGDDAVKTIGLNNGSLVVNDPCWEASITV